MKTHSIRVFLVFLALISSIHCISTRPTINTENDNNPFEMREGVVIDPGRRMMYVMNTTGGVSAIQLSNGESIWHSNMASKPLQLIGNLLICQTDLGKPENTFKIVALNVQKQGEAVYRDSISLPKNVWVMIDDQMNSSFETVNKISGSSLYVFWKYILKEIEATPQLDSIPKLYEITEGIVKIDPANRTITTAKNAPDSIKQLPPNLTQEELLKGKPEIQFRSADNKHVLISQRISDDRVWNKYFWLIFDKSKSKYIGKIGNHVSYSPFFVSNQMVHLETKSYYERSAGNIPLSIQSFDIKSEKKNWSVAIRDTEYKDFFPPK